MVSAVGFSLGNLGGVESCCGRLLPPAGTFTLGSVRDQNDNSISFFNLGHWSQESLPTDKYIANMKRRISQKASENGGIEAKII